MGASGTTGRWARGSEPRFASPRRGGERYNNGMTRSAASLALLGVLLAPVSGLAQPAAAQAPPADVQIEAAPEPKPEGAKVVPPPLHYETTRPPDATDYGHDVRVE